MAVSREEYEKLVAREMRRYGRGGTGGESSRDKAVRAANVAAGYGNSTALKYPVKAGGGGRTLSRDGDDTKAKSTGGGGSKSSGGGGGGGGGSNLPNISRNPYETQRGSPRGGPPGRLSDENAGPGTGVSAPYPGAMFLLGSPFAPMPSRMPGPQVPLAVDLPAAGGARPEGPPGQLPAARRATRTVMPGPQDVPPTLMPVGPQPVAPAAPGVIGMSMPEGTGSGIMDILRGLQQQAGQAGRIVAPWLQDQMFNR